MKSRPNVKFRPHSHAASYVLLSALTLKDWNERFQRLLDRKLGETNHEAELARAAELRKLCIGGKLPTFFRWVDASQSDQLPGRVRGRSEARCGDNH